MATTAFFVTDLHGKITRYKKLFREIVKEKPACVFWGGDLLPHRMRPIEFGGKKIKHFVEDYLIEELTALKAQMGDVYPEMFMILGNDDARSEEHLFLEMENRGLCTYINQKKVSFGAFAVFGYSFVPPTPFLIKDWEKYDVSRYVDPGCVPPTEGYRTVDPDYDPEYATIKKDLETLIGDKDLSTAIFLFHSPPYQSHHDRAALDGQTYEHVPLDVHVGSIAIKELIETHQPYITLHGHIHESSRLTGYWAQKFGKTHTFSAAWDGPELSIVKFDLENPTEAERILL